MPQRDMMKQILKKYLGKKNSDRIAVLISEILWTFDPRARRSKKFLKSYENKFGGEKCVILGNGPSLNRTDLSVLGQIKTFGQNRIYLAEGRIKPTFLVSVNGLVAEQFSNEIENFDSIKFMSWANRKHFNNDNEEIIYLWDPSGGFDYGFSLDLTERVYIDSTVTFVSLQLACWLGFSEIALVGVDHYFSTKGQNDAQVTSGGDDLNHFDKRYFGAGIKWNLPNLENSEKSYLLAKEVMKKKGVSIYDCTVDGKLEIFTKMDLNRFVGSSNILT